MAWTKAWSNAVTLLEQQYGWSLELTREMVSTKTGKVEKVQLKKRKLKLGTQTECSKRADNEIMRNLTR